MDASPAAQAVPGCCILFRLGCLDTTEIFVSQNTFSCKPSPPVITSTSSHVFAHKLVSKANLCLVKLRVTCIHHGAVARAS